MISPETSDTRTNLLSDGPCPPWLEKIHFQHHPGDQLLLPADGGPADGGDMFITGPTAGIADACAATALGRLVTRVEPATVTS